MTTKATSAPATIASTTISPCPPGAKERNASTGSAKPKCTTSSAKAADIAVMIAQNPSAASTTPRNSPSVMPRYLAPMPSPMKNCAARIASAGGRWWISPKRLAAIAAIIGPRIAAPKSRTRTATHQPTTAQAEHHRELRRRHLGRRQRPAGPVERAAPEPAEERRHHRDDREHPGRMDEAERARVAAGRLRRAAPCPGTRPASPRNRRSAHRSRRPAGSRARRPARSR